MAGKPRYRRKTGHVQFICFRELRIKSLSSNCSSR
jgi:hypothetical protein